jgi:5-methylcytosine-specific restriction endonuclease McrA
MSRDWSEALDKKRREGRCRACSSSSQLEAAHVIPRSLGGDQHELATVPLCRSCHRAYDSRELDLLPHLTHAEQAHAVGLVGMFTAWHVITGERPT